MSGPVFGSDPIARSATSGCLPEVSFSNPFVNFFTRQVRIVMIIVDEKRNPKRFTAALWLVVQRYAAQVRRRPGVCVPALLLPGIGDVLVFYTPPLVIA